jgi:hypothetical protein
MTTHRYAHYIYTLTNTTSIALLCILVVAAGSLIIKFLAPDAATAEILLKRIAWPLWGLAFLIRSGQWAWRTWSPS